MMEDEDQPRKPLRRLTPLPLDTLGVAELAAYVAELQAEIARAEAEMARKRDHRGAADALFRRG
jgi:uncharacterized small protein (DUF1192 family)